MLYTDEEIWASLLQYQYMKFAEATVKIEITPLEFIWSKGVTGKKEIPMKESPKIIRIKKYYERKKYLHDYTIVEVTSQLAYPIKAWLDSRIKIHRHHLPLIKKKFMSIKNKTKTYDIIDEHIHSYIHTYIRNSQNIDM